MTFGEPLFNKLIWTPAYRGQVLHHAAVYQTRIIMFVVGTQSKIVYIVLACFKQEDIQKYYDIMNIMKVNHLDWFHDDIKNYPKDLEFKHAVDNHTVQLWRKLGEALRDLFDENGDLRPAHEIKPYIVVLWNLLKGGQDVMSRMLTDVKIDFKNLSPRCYVFMRQIKTQLLNIHHILHLITLFESYNQNLDSFKK